MLKTKYYKKNRQKCYKSFLDLVSTEVRLSGIIQFFRIFLVASRSADERFFGGPRFGRSGNGGIIFGNSELDTRNPERFFIGSRYGKRSEMQRKI